MDLKQFVSGTITQIAEGIREAQSNTKGTGVWINPVGSVVSGVAATKDIRCVETSSGNAYLQEVKFDVAVTVSDTQGAGAR